MSPITIILLVAVLVAGGLFARHALKVRERAKRHEAARARIYSETCGNCGGAVHPVAKACRHCHAVLPDRNLLNVARAAKGDSDDETLPQQAGAPLHAQPERPQHEQHL